MTVGVGWGVGLCITVYSFSVHTRIVDGFTAVVQVFMCVKELCQCEVYTCMYVK